MENKRYQKFESLTLPLCVMIKGRAGTGKTSLAVKLGTMKKSDGTRRKCALINFDRNLECLSRISKECVDNVFIINPYLDKNGNQCEPRKVWDNFVDILKETFVDSEIDTIIVDSIMFLEDALKAKVLNGSDKKLSFDEWDKVRLAWKWLGDYVIQSKNRDKSFILIAHEQDVLNDEGNLIKISLAMSGQMKDLFEAYFANVWRCTVESRMGKPTRYVVTGVPTSMCTAKISVDGLPAQWTFEEAEKALSNKF